MTKATDWINDWPKGSEPRSLPYREGVQAGYDWVIAGRPRGGLPKPNYALGTAELDAYLAGLDHGKRLANR